MLPSKELVLRFNRNISVQWCFRLSAVVKVGVAPAPVLGASSLPQVSSFGYINFVLRFCGVAVLQSSDLIKK